MSLTAEGRPEPRGAPLSRILRWMSEPRFTGWHVVSFFVGMTLARVFL